MTTASIAIVTIWAAAGTLLGLYGLRTMHRDARDREARRVITGITALTTRPVVVAPSPLARRAGTSHGSDEIAATPPGYVGRHALIGDRDPRLAALLEPTQVYAAMVEALTGRTLHEVGPREADIRGRRVAGAPWTPPALDEVV